MAGGIVGALRANAIERVRNNNRVWRGGGRDGNIRN
jgi:hypothetical protein